MKTFYGISLFLLCFIVSYGDALAVDFTIKTNIMRTYTETITPAPASSPASCSSISSTTLPAPMTLTMQVVDSQITQFTVRVVEKGNVGNVVAGPSTHDITGGNFNLSNGELTHTITGIPSRKYTLVVELYKGNSVSGSPYFQQEISTARSTKVVSGFIEIGDIGSGTTIASYGGTVTGGSKSNTGGDASIITVNIEAQPDANYSVIGSYISMGTLDNDNDVRPMAIYSKNPNSFQVYVEGTCGCVQNLRLDFIIQGYQ